MKKYVYLFQEGNKDMKNILGGKGANLAEMTLLGLPVPQGFTITTEACNQYYENHESLTDEMKEEILQTIHHLEQITGKVFGAAHHPLLVSVRSGARASMPGMMDTILNLGMNDEIVEVLAEETEPRFAYDSYRRFIMMFADVVKGIDKSLFEGYLDEYKTSKGISADLDLTAKDMKEIANTFKEIYVNHLGENFPQNPMDQLLASVCAVFKSWNNERAIYFRKLNDIPSSWGTAVNVQEMVYGNRGENSGTGVAFTRNPATGEKGLFGEYLINAQGEDVVAGIRTPNPISKLQEEMPVIYQEFEKISTLLENHYKDMQDMEFTIENGRLFMLQTRNGKRTGTAAIKIAVDMVREGKITKEEAILSIDPKNLDSLLHKNFASDDLKLKKVIATGLAASPGAASGKIYFHAKDAIAAHKNGEKVILVRLETSPEDIEGMHHAEGILTIRGGMTSHAAVVARGMGTCCVSGCDDLTIDEKKKILITKNGEVYNEKSEISLDGTTGRVYEGPIRQVEPTLEGDFKEFMSWVDAIDSMKVRANADNEFDARLAREFGADGIGLVRTEHMFFDSERIFTFRKMILADDLEERTLALNEILPYQQSDFESIYRVMKGCPVVIRYLDPPLHEFLPKKKEEILELANALHKSEEEIQNRIDALKEFNPMMGHRGCRLAITYPEILEMQTKAVIGAAIQVQKEGISVAPEIMIPLIGEKKELEFVKRIVCEVADNLIAAEKTSLHYEVGTMIEIPRACLISNELASCAEFFSFGTNDLTQLTYGFSRDDAGKFLNVYYDKRIFEQDPFQRIDERGVGLLMKVAINEARKINPTISLGVCGEHGGDPKSIEFCHKLGLNYVSCSPYRIPIAKLSCVQASIREKVNK